MVNTIKKLCKGRETPEKTATDANIERPDNKINNDEVGLHLSLPFVS